MTSQELKAKAKAEAEAKAKAEAEAKAKAEAEAKAKAEDILGLNHMDGAALLERAIELGVDGALKTAIIKAEQVKREALLIEKIKEAFHLVGYPFEAEQVLAIRVTPQNGSFTVVLNAVKSLRSAMGNANGKVKVRITAPDGTVEEAKNAAEYCRTHDGLNEGKGSAIAYLQGKEYKVEKVEG